MQRAYGSASWAGPIVSVLIMWTAFASVFSLMLGYSRVPYAAAVDGNYFRAFAKVHPVHKFPYVSLLALAGVAALFCFLRLADLIAALVVIRILLQFLVQSIGVIVLTDSTAGYAASVPDVAVSLAGSGGGREFHVYLDLTQRLPAGDSVRWRDSGGGAPGLLSAVLAARGVAVCGVTRG